MNSQSPRAGEPMVGTYDSLHEFITELKLGDTERVMSLLEAKGIDSCEDLDQAAVNPTDGELLSAAKLVCLICCLNYCS